GPRAKRIRSLRRTRVQIEECSYGHRIIAWSFVPVSDAGHCREPIAGRSRRVGNIAGTATATAHRHVAQMVCRSRERNPELQSLRHDAAVHYRAREHQRLERAHAILAILHLERSYGIRVVDMERHSIRSRLGRQKNTAGTQLNFENIL